MKYSTVDYRKFSSQRRFGIELEIGCSVSKVKIKNAIQSMTNRPVIVTRYQPSTDNCFWHVKSDATCGPKGRNGAKGVEIASFVGTGIYDLQHIADVSQRLDEIGCQINDNCGLHIHAEAVDLSKAQVGTLLAYWLKLELCLQHALPPRRRDNEYCKMISSRDGFRCSAHRIREICGALNPENIYCLLSPTDINYYENQDRRINLNLVNYTRACTYETNSRKTLELRWPEGTLASLDVKCWTRLFLNFIDFCKDRPFPRDLTSCNLLEALDFLGLAHKPKIFTIFSEGLFETKTWLLERFVKYDETSLKNEALDILNTMCSPAKKYA